MVAFTDNDIELRVVVGQIWYTSAAPHRQDIYLEPVFFLGSYEEWESHNSVSHQLPLLGVGCLIQYENVIWVKFAPGVRELIAINHQKGKQSHESTQTFQEQGEQE